MTGDFVSRNLFWSMIIIYRFSQNCCFPGIITNSGFSRAMR
jgi:hypothetical protein